MYGVIELFNRVKYLKKLLIAINWVGFVCAQLIYRTVRFEDRKWNLLT